MSANKDKVCIATIKIMVKADKAVEACDGIGELLRSAFVIDWGYLDADINKGLFYYPVMYLTNMEEYIEGDFVAWSAPAPSSRIGEYEEPPEGK